MGHTLVAFGGFFLLGGLRLFRRGPAQAVAANAPPSQPFAPRHWLGAALLEAERAEAAEEVYRTALVKHPHNGWSIYGLEQALRAQGRGAEADEARSWFREAWYRTDTLIRSSRF